MRLAVRRWKVITESPTTAGSRSRSSRSTVSLTRRSTSTRSATATSWCGSRLPASDDSAPLGMRIATDGMCSNESGIESSSTFMGVA